MKTTRYPILFILILFTINPSFTQTCFPQGIMLDTQLEINSFATNYPNCTIIEGDLIIGTLNSPGINNPQLKNLFGLSQITEIKGDLIFRSHTNIKDFVGLDNLAIMGGDINLVNGFSLNSFKGLNSLVSVGGSIIIDNMPVTRLDELTSLNSVEGSIYIDNCPIEDLQIPNLMELGGLRIINCSTLTDLNGFQNITEIDRITLDDVRNLSSVSGFPLLTKVNGSLFLSDRHNLTDLGGLASIDSIGELEFHQLKSDFPTFPNVTEVGNLIYYAIYQNDLIELPMLDTVHNDLIITYYNQSSISWIGKIKSIGGLTISNCDNLQNLGGIDNLQHLNDLTIIENNSLETLSGFNNFTHLRNLTISQVDHIDGLQSIVEIENLQIDFGFSFGSITGLSNLATITNDAIITTYEYKGLRAFDQLESIGNDLILVNPYAFGSEEENNIFPLLKTIGNNFDGTKLSRFSDFKNLDSIKNSLIIRDCRFSDFSGFESLAPVKSISIRSSDIDSFTNMSTFVDDSTSFYLVDFGGENLDGLESVTSLKNLSLSENEDLVSIDGLRNLESVHNSLWIDDNDKLLTLTSMESLRTVGELWILDSKIDSLPNGIEQISGQFYMSDNENLNNIDGLLSLTHLGGGIEFRDNPVLRNLDGLSNLEYFKGWIVLRYNENIRDISGLASIPDASLISSLTIKGQEHLDECNIEVLCEYLQIPDQLVDFEYNGTNCNEDDIYCENHSISGYFFYDENENGIKDSNEKGISYGSAQDTERDITKRADADGFYQFYTFIDSSYTIDYYLSLAGFPSIKDNWELTTDSSYTIIFEKGNPLNTTLNFGFTPTYISDECTGFNSSSFETQKKINGFPYGFPWCHVMDDDLFVDDIMSGNIIDLSPFSQLNKVTGEVKIDNNNELESLYGLHNILTIEDDLTIEYLPKLKDLDALSQLKSIDGRLEIRSNDMLKNLFGIANLDHEGVSYLLIRSNDSMSVCDVPFICKYLSSGKSYIINSNMPACSEDELFGCGNQFFGGRVFYDLNSNKQKDDNEFGISNYPITINDQTTLSNQVGYYFTVGENGVQYESNIEVLPEYNLTTDSTSFVEIYNEDIPAFDHDFGLIFNENIRKTQLNLSSNPNRCSELISFRPVVLNEGAPIIDATIELRLDLQTQLNGYELDPTGLDTLTNTYWWNLDTLQSFESFDQFLTIQMPDFNSLGDTLNYTLSVYEGNNDIALDSYHYQTVVLCSYDPNDKLVSPAGLGDKNYTLFEDSLLTYTIRFQNTGNDYAKNIRITDTLSELLDLNTFKVVNSSFPVITTIDGRYVDFSFRDIYLPDSTANEPESHGFVTYQIETIPDLDENDIVENTAFIYFDFNPAIVTNTIKNTMVSMYPEILDVVDNISLDVRIAPTPSQNYFRLINLSKRKIIKVQLYGQDGRMIKEMDGNNDLFDISELTAGYYTTRILFENGTKSIPLVKI